MLLYYVYYIHPDPLSTKPDLGSRRKGLPGVSNMTKHIAVWSPVLLGWGKPMIQKGKGFVSQFPMYPYHCDLYQCCQASPIACATLRINVTVFPVLELGNQSGIIEDQTSDSWMTSTGERTGFCWYHWIQWSKCLSSEQVFIAIWPDVTDNEGNCVSASEAKETTKKQGGVSEYKGEIPRTHPKLSTGFGISQLNV
jgi:hypothetical protein